jgi:7-cyano-7-deazaguanine synthase
LAILVSGGLDSAILLGEQLRNRVVYPLYVRFGLTWEAVELAHLRRFLDALACSRLRPLVVLDMPIADVYGNHWSTTGQQVPGADTADEAVFLPGRNALLLVKALVWCHLHGAGQLAMAPLEGNPFPDATADFFQAYSQSVNLGMGGTVEVVLPYRTLSKVEVLNRGADLPLQHTFSCIQPVDGQHCGRCNKCAERQKGFARAGLADPTLYAG